MSTFHQVSGWWFMMTQRTSEEQDNFVILTEDGDPILTEDEKYLLTES